ncbi:protein containing Radical SAM [Rhodopirellula maiorica SM1]|uniref:Protein containing Radical SAM n=2 Tax=Novipirellula TaxID=2795426 RepID=M5RSP5_9BACT|nr:protein containing Radical SAM [Rhodopirellula maiorica SM1]
MARDYLSNLAAGGRAPTGPVAARPLPMSMKEARDRGWDELDIVFVTGDAYIDHPSFAMAILGRTLEAAGFRVGIISQPDWRSCEPWKTFGRPRLFFGISAGNMDSMINHYTANKKVRNDDAYSPGGKIGLRPDRATLSYCQRAREAYKGVPVIAGGVEASLRRLAHYDYWSDKVKRSILLDSKADLVAFGMGENAIVEMAKRLDAGEDVKALRDMLGVAYTLGASESDAVPEDALRLPSFDEVTSDKVAFAEATRIIHNETNPYNARPLAQQHGTQTVVCTIPQPPISEAAMDQLYGLPYTRRPHPSYKEPIPAYEMIKNSVTIMRGCFGGCTFCSITAHQGRIIQSRSKESILGEISKMTKDKSFKGVVSDIGGPTANMYQMKCTRPEVEAVCRRQSCVHPKICKLLGVDHTPVIELMRESRNLPGIKKVLVASGIRMDLARTSPEYLKELTAHHVGGKLKVAPEHVDAGVLNKMRKPKNDDFEHFTDIFKEESQRVGKKQFIVPYFIASHPGSDVRAMIELALFLKRNGYKPDAVQDFIPAPLDIATTMYYTELDPFTKKPVYIAKAMKERKMQRALMQFFKPENYFEVREALRSVGRTDLIGDGCDGLIPSKPPQEAIRARRSDANKRFRGEYVHTIAKPGTKSGATASGEQKKGSKKKRRDRKSTGYRPDRRGAN